MLSGVDHVTIVVTVQCSMTLALKLGDLFISKWELSKKLTVQFAPFQLSNVAPTTDYIMFILCISWNNQGRQSWVGTCPPTFLLPFYWKRTFAHPLFTNSSITFGLTNPLWRSFLRPWTIHYFLKPKRYFTIKSYL